MFGHPDTIELLAREVESQESDDEESLRHVLPPGLDTMSPGPLLSAALTTVDRSKLNGHDVVRYTIAASRMKSHYEALMLAGMAEVAYSPPGAVHSQPERTEIAHEYASDEIRAALTWTRTRADNEMSFALDLRERYPQVWALLDRGEIDMPRVRTIVNGVGSVSRKAALQIVDRIIEHAPRLTTGQLGARIRKLSAEIEPEEVEARYTDTVEERKVIFEQSLDLSGEAHAYGIPIQRASAIGRRINGYAYALKNAGDDRTLDQLRTDVFLDLLEGNPVEGSQRGTVDIRIDLTTLAGLDDKAGEIPGMGPVIADIARKTALAQKRAQWIFTVTDENGDIVTADITRRRASAAQKRRINALHPTCSFPGCRVPAKDCDVDHIDPWSEGGKTTVTNSDIKCDHDHQLRDYGWVYKRIDGSHVWISPLGHTYIKERDPP